METLKEALEVLIGLAEKADADLEDGKFSVAEGVGMAMNGLGLIKVIKSFDEIKNEFFQLTKEQKEELTRWFAHEFQLREKNAEQIVEEVFGALIQLSDSMKRIAEPA